MNTRITMNIVERKTHTESSNKQKLGISSPTKDSTYPLATPLEKNLEELFIL